MSRLTIITVDVTLFYHLLAFLHFWLWIPGFLSSSCIRLMSKCMKEPTSDVIP